MWSDLKQLGKEYKESRKPITKRINELKQKKDNLKRGINSIKKENRTEIEIAIKDIADRLKPLNAISRDLSETGREAQKYYDGGHWRDERYTCNQRKSYFHFGSTGPYSDEYEQEKERTNVGFHIESYGQHSHRKAKRSDADVLRRKEKNA